MRRIAKIACVAAATITLMGMGDCTPMPQPAPLDPENAGTVDDCAPACATLERLRCPGYEGSPGRDDEYGTDDDVPCVQACADLIKSYPGATLYQRCIARSSTCDVVDRCVAKGE